MYPVVNFKLRISIQNSWPNVSHSKTRWTVLSPPRQTGSNGPASAAFAAKIVSEAAVASAQSAAKSFMLGEGSQGGRADHISASARAPSGS